MKKLIALLALSIASSAFAIETRFEEDRSLPLVSVNVVIKAGAAHDPKGQSGITNFMGEMLKRGSKKYSKEKILEALDQIGGSLEVETRAEALILRGSVLAEKLSQFLDLVTEIVSEPTFPEHEIKKLKAEVVSSILEERGNDRGLARARWESFLMSGHPYGNPLLGKMKDVESITRAQIEAHYKKLFQNRNTIVIGTGDAEESFIRSWSDRLAEVLPNSEGPNPVEPVGRPELAQKLRVRVIDKPDRTQTQVYWGQEGVLFTDPKFFPLYLGNHAFGGGSFSARFMVEIRVKRGWAYGAYSYFRHGLQPRSWQAFTFPASKDTPDAVKYGLSMIQELKGKGITQEEYDFAKTSLINSAGFMYNTPKKRVENLILEQTLNLPPGFTKSYGPALSRVSIDDVNAALKAFLHPERFSILVLGTAKTLKPKLAEKLGMKESEIETVPYTVE